MDSPADVTFCDHPTEPDPVEVIFCDNQAEPDPVDVVFCDQEDEEDDDGAGNGGEDASDDDCAAAGALIISGAGSPANGDGYGVTGGVGPFSWSVSGGASLTDSGPRGAIISGVDNGCGTGTVTVTDTGCGQSASMNIRYPLGIWIYEDEEWGDPCDLGGGSSCTHYSGKYRYDYVWNHQSASWPSYLGCSGCLYDNHISAHPCTGEALPVDCGRLPVTRLATKVFCKRYRWSCP